MHNEVYGSEDGRGELSLKHESGISNALAEFGAKEDQGLTPRAE